MVDIAPSSSKPTEESTTLVSGNKKIDYEKWTKEQLIDKIRKLELHVFQLRNVIAKRSDSKQCFYEVERKRKREDGGGGGEDQRGNAGQDADDNDNLSSSNGRKVKKPRPFDFSLHDTRHIALKFLYLGWDYQGFASQEDTNDTIEAHLFKALKMTRLIEDRNKSNYHRCGRTDKGVSAFQQVVSLDVRSKIDPVTKKETINYCDMLNHVLPKNIRMLAWAPVRPNFSARFDCNRRTYKYFFPRGDLDLTKMQDAAKYLIGEHDFRNLCKMDKDKTTMRRVIKVDIVSPPTTLGTEEGTHPLDSCKLVILGQSFVWHQIRCIAAVLILVGKGLEEPEIVRELLDIEKNPRKPQYSMGVDYPLCLYTVRYPDEDNEERMEWEYPKHTISSVVADLQTIWTEHAVKTAMITEMMKDVESQCQSQDLDLDPSQLTQCLLMGTKRKTHVKLMDRPKCGN